MIPGLLSSPVGLLARLDDIPPCGNGPFPPPPPPLGGGLLGGGLLGDLLKTLPGMSSGPIGDLFKTLPGMSGDPIGGLIGELLGNAPVHASSGTQVGSEG